MSIDKVLKNKSLLGTRVEKKRKIFLFVIKEIDKSIRWIAFKEKGKNI